MLATNKVIFMHEHQLKAIIEANFNRTSPVITYLENAANYYPTAQTKLCFQYREKLIKIYFFATGKWLLIVDSKHYCLDNFSSLLNQLKQVIK